MASSTGIAADSEPTSAPGLPVDNEDGGQRDDRSAAPPDPAGSGLGRLRRAATNPTNWRVRTKLIAILIVPVAAIVAYSSIAAGSALTSTRDVNRVSELTTISRSAVSLAHNLEKERTYSVGFVASGAVGARDNTSLPPLQTAVNDAYQAYRSTTNGRRGSFGSNVRQALDDVQTRMDSLPAKRLTVKSLVDPKAVQTAYQPIIDSLVNLLQLIPQGNDDQELANGVNSAFFMMSTSELLAQQQALVFGLVTQGSNRPFTEGDFREFLSAETQRTRARDQLENVAGPAQMALYTPTIDADTNRDIENTDNYVETVLGSPVNQPLGAIDPTKWNRSTQETIDVGADAADRMLGLVDDRVDTLRGDIQRRALLSGLLVVLILAAALLSALVVARSLVRPLLALRTAALDIADRRLPDAVRRLRDSTDQDFDDSIESVGITTDEEVGEVARAFDEVHREAVRLASEQASLRNNVNAMFVNLSRRSQGLVERQLRLIDDLENREQDPDQLANLFKLDHLATRMRRNNESLLVLAGTDTARRWTHPVPLNEVVLAAISEVEQYTRVKQTSAAPVSIAGNGVSDVVHLVAELLENATSYSPPVTDVLVTSHSLGPGAGAMIEIEDQGIGMPAKELERINERLANPPIVDVSVSRTMGLFAVGRLASRHGIRVQLRESSSGGITAVVRLPAKLVTGDSAASGPGRAPTLTRTPEAPALPAGSAGDAERTLGPGERAGALTAGPGVPGRGPDPDEREIGLVGAGSTNGSGNGSHRTGGEPPAREGFFDDSSGPRRFPTTGPFPLTGPLAVQPSSDRTGPIPTTNRADLGLDQFAPGDQFSPGATGPRNRDGGNGGNGGDPRGHGPRPFESRESDTGGLRDRGPTGPGDHGTPPPAVTPDTETIERRGPAAREQQAPPDVTSPMSFGDSRWPSRPRPEAEPPARERPDTAPGLPIRERPEPESDRLPNVPARPDGPARHSGPVRPDVPARPDAPARVDAPTGPRTGSVFVRGEERAEPAPPSQPRPEPITGPRAVTPAPTGPGQVSPQAAVAEAPEATETADEQAAAELDTDDVETSPIFDSVSAWFQRRSPADEAAAQAGPAAQVPPRRTPPQAPRPAPEPAAAAAPPIRRPGLGGAFGHRAPGRPGADPLTGPRPIPQADPVVEAAPAAPAQVPAYAAQNGPQSQPPVAQPAAAMAQPFPQQQAGQPQAAPQAPQPQAPQSPAGGGWSSPGDAGFQAAEALRQPSSGGMTRSGLPVRVPMTHLVPGSAEPAPRRRPPADTSTRSPEAVGGRLASFYQGVRQGRDVGVDTTRNPRRDAQEER